MDISIRKAIQQKLLIEFYYDGGIRIVEPHCYGISTAGNPVLRAYQITGTSKSGLSSGWKLFDLSKIINLAVSSQSFIGVRPGFNPNDSAMTSIYCHAS